MEARSIGYGSGGVSLRIFTLGELRTADKPPSSSWTVATQISKHTGARGMLFGIPSDPICSGVILTVVR